MLTSQYPEIAVDGTNNIHIIWKEDNNDLYYKKWNATSATWETPLILYDGTNLVIWSFAIDADSYGNAHVVFSEIGGVDFDIYYFDKLFS